MRWLESITDSVDRGEQTLGDSGGRGAWRAAVHGVAELQMTARLNNKLLRSACGTLESYRT